MYDNSYLFTSITSDVKYVYFTLDSNDNSDYVLYLTESDDLGAIEPDWVKHEECFVGKLLSDISVFRNKR